MNHPQPARSLLLPTWLRLFLAAALVCAAMAGTSIPLQPATGANPAAVTPVTAAPGDEWTQEAHDAQRTGYTSEEPATPWTLAWTFNGPDANGGTGNHLYNAPAEAHTVTGGNNVYVPAGSLGLFALAKTNGAQAWRLTSPSFNATPAYDPASGFLFAGGGDGKLYKINGSTGQVSSTYNAGSPINKAVLLSGGSAYVVTDSGELHKINTSNMGRAWLYSAGSAIATPPALSARAGVIVYATADLNVHAVKDADGKAQWKVKPTIHPAQQPYTFSGFWPVIAEQHGIVFVRLNLGFDALWSGNQQGTSGGGVYPSSNAATRTLLQADNGARENLFALDLATGAKKFIPAVGYGGVEKRSGSNLTLQSGPAPVVKVNSDGSEVAYIPFRTGQTNPPDGRWDSHMGEMVLDNSTVSGMVAGDMRFVQFPNSYVHITDEQTPLTMAGATMLHAHWGASEAARITDRSAGRGLTYANPITAQALPAVIRRQTSCSNFDAKTHYTTCGLALLNDGHYWNGPGYWTYWNTMDPPTPVSSAYSDGLLPRYTYVSSGMLVVEGNGGEILVFRHAGSSAPIPTAVPPTKTPTPGGPTLTASPTRTSTLPALTPTGPTLPTPTLPVSPTATLPVPPTATLPVNPTAAPTLPVPPTATLPVNPTAAPTLPVPPTAVPTQPATLPAPTATQPPTGGDSLTLDSYTDFKAAGATTSNVIVNDQGDGSLSLAGRLLDEFTAASVNTSLWTATSFSGGSYAPRLSGGILTMPARGYLRSRLAFTRGALEITAAFERAPNQYAGFGGAPSSGPRYAMFTTLSGDGNLYAVVNNNTGDDLTNLGPIPSGFHRYRIEWANTDAARDTVSFFVDGQPVIQKTFANAGASNWNVYLANNGAGSYKVDLAQASPNYVSSGTYTSASYDAGLGSTWQTISWNATASGGAKITMRTRTSANGSSWTTWSTVAASGNAIAKPNRLLQFQITFSTTNANISPVIDSVTLTKSKPGPAPTSTLPAAPTATLPAGPTPTLPVSPTAMLPVFPTATPPAAPTATLPIAPTLPVSPTATLPVAPTATPPVVPTTTPPAAPTATLPVAPTATPPPATLPAPTATQPPVTTNLTINSYSELASAAASKESVFVSEQNGGVLTLAGQGADLFDGSGLDMGRWTPASISGGTYNPAVSGGALRLTGGGFIRSKAAFNRATLEATLTFERAAGLYAGFGAEPSGGPRYFVFSTLAGDGNLYAVVNNNTGDDAANLGAVPSGPHRYRIEWDAGSGGNERVLFFIDGQQVAEKTAASQGISNWNLYLANSGSGALSADEIQAAPAFATSGAFTSTTFDAGAGATWQSIALSVNGSVSVETRTSPDGSAWSNWTAVNGGVIAAPARYLQFRLALQTGDPQTSPVVDSVTLTKTSAPAPTQPPPATAVPTTVPTVAPTSGATASPTLTASPTSKPATSTPVPTLPPVTPTATYIAPTLPVPTAPGLTPTLPVSPTPSGSPTPGPTPRPGAPAISNIQLVAGSPAVYEKFEVQFSVQTAAKTLDMPYDPNPPAGLPAGTGVTVNGLFSNDNWKTTIVQPGFLYQPFTHSVVSGKDHFTPSGAPVFAVRFAPQQAGAWQYKLSVQDSQGQTTSPAAGFSVGASSANTHIRRGFLRVGLSDRRYFEFQNGQPFVGVGFNDGFEENAAELEQKMTVYEQNQMNFFRLWLSGSGINGSQWTAWASHHLSNDGYLPGVSFDMANTYDGSLVSMRLDNANPCFYADFWRGSVPVEPNTKYEVSARIKTANVTSSGDGGFVIKQGDWLDKACANSGTGKRITAPVKGNTDWTVVTGTYTTGSTQRFLPNLYLTRENASGTVYINEVHLYRADDPSKADLLRQPYASVIEHFDSMSAAYWDLYIQAAERHGVYLKLVTDEKNEWIRNRLGADGKPAAADNNNFYAKPGTKVRWLEEAWWRYLIARWGYSTAVHSFEYINEGDPYNGNHYEAADAMARYFDQNDPSRHMVTTSFWHSFPGEFWSYPGYSAVDYADIHAYISTGWGTDASFIPAQMQETAPANVHGGATSARLGPNHPSVTIVPRGLVIQGQGEWVIQYWMKTNGLAATCGYGTTGSKARVRWRLDGGTYNGGKEGVIPNNAEGRDFVCTSPSGTFDWRQFNSRVDRDGQTLPESVRIILADNNPHSFSVSLENPDGTAGTVWIDDVQLVSPGGQVQPVLGTFETTAMDADSAWFNQAYGQLLGGGSLVGARKPLVRGETGLDYVGNQAINPDLNRDTQGIWLHNNVWGQINSGGMYDMFWWATETIPQSIWSNFLTYRNFMADIPLSNGRYKDSGAAPSTAQLRVVGQRDDSGGRMHLWIYNAQHTWKNVVAGANIPAVSGTITIPNVPAGSYRVEWWNTYAASNPVTLTQTVSANGSLTLTLPSALKDDVAVKVYKQ